MLPSRDIDIIIMKSFFIYSGIVVGIVVILFFAPVPAARAATNISSTTAQHFAWNDEIGWIDFYSTGNVNVLSSQLQGYASSSAGVIALDCATSPSPGCTINYGVSNDGGGNLSGWAWNDKIGWISFCGNSSGGFSTWNGTKWVCPSVPTYQVTISPSTGVFSGWAWNDVIGWINFNCSQTSSCGASNFDVATIWVATSTTGTLDSQTFDTGVANGAQLNSITWKGNVPSNTSVSFEVAVSNSSSGPWNFMGPCAGSGTNGGIISLGSCTSYVSLVGRYFRYRVILTTNVAQTTSSRITSVIVNWSP